jgi:hypothetical protein
VRNKIIFLLVPIVFASIILFFCLYNRQSTNLSCKRQLADFSPLFILYEEYNGHNPACFNDILEPWNNDRELFGCPEYLGNNKSDKSLGYILVNWKRQWGDIPKDAPLVYDMTFKSHHNGVYVLTANGKVIFIKDKNYFIKFKKINSAVIIPKE